MSNVTVTQALEASAVLDANNEAHEADVNQVIASSTVRDGSTAIVDGSQLQAPAVHSAAAKVLLNSLDVEFVKTMGSHTVWHKN